MARAKQTSQEYLDLINIHPHQIINLRGIRRHFPTTFGLMCIRTFPYPIHHFHKFPLTFPVTYSTGNTKSGRKEVCFRLILPVLYSTSMWTKNKHVKNLQDARLIMSGIIYGKHEYLTMDQCVPPCHPPQCCQSLPFEQRQAVSREKEKCQERKYFKIKVCVIAQTMTGIANIFTREMCRGLKIHIWINIFSSEQVVFVLVTKYVQKTKMITRTEKMMMMTYLMLWISGGPSSHHHDSNHHRHHQSNSSKSHSHIHVSLLSHLHPSDGISLK